VIRVTTGITKSVLEATYLRLDGSNSPMTGDLNMGTNAITNVTNLTLNGTIDLGTNTITDGSMSGNWDFGSGNLTTTGTLGAGETTITLANTNMTVKEYGFFGGGFNMPEIKGSTGAVSLYGLNYLRGKTGTVDPGYVFYDEDSDGGGTVATCVMQYSGNDDTLNFHSMDTIAIDGNLTTTGTVTWNGGSSTATNSHISDNTQAHSDYMLNTGDTSTGDYDFGSGDLTTTGEGKFAKVNVGLGLTNPAGEMRVRSQVGSGPSTQGGSLIMESPGPTGQTKVGYIWLGFDSKYNFTDVPPSLGASASTGQFIIDTTDGSFSGADKLFQIDANGNYSSEQAPGGSGGNDGVDFSFAGNQGGGNGAGGGGAVTAYDGGDFTWAGGAGGSGNPPLVDVNGGDGGNAIINGGAKGLKFAGGVDGVDGFVLIGSADTQSTLFGYGSPLSIDSDGDLTTTGTGTFGSLLVDKIYINDDDIYTANAAANLDADDINITTGNGGESSPGGSAYDGGDVNITSGNGGTVGPGLAGNINLLTGTGDTCGAITIKTGAGGATAGNITIQSQNSATNDLGEVHIKGTVYGGDAGVLYLQEDGGGTVIGDNGAHAGIKVYVQGDTGGVVDSPSVCQFIASTARGGGASADGGDTIFEATGGGIATEGNYDGGDGGDIIFNPGIAGIPFGTGSAGSIGNILLNGQVIGSTNISVGTSSPSAGFRGTGDIYATSGIKAMEGLYSEAVAFGAGLEVGDNALVTTYTNASNGDASLVASTQTLTDSHASFTSAYIGQFIKIISSTPSFTGATGEIVAVPSGTTIVISFATAGGTAVSDSSAMSFIIYPQPNFFVGDNGDIHASVGENQDASFKINSPYGANDHSIHAVVTAGINGHCGFDMDIDAHTYGGVSGYCLNYDATAYVAGITGQGINMIINNSGATGGDLHGIDVAVTDTANTDMETVAVGSGPGVDVIHQHLGTAAAIVSAFTYDLSTTTYTDVTTAFGSTGTNVQMFTGDNDEVLIGSLTKFDQVNVILSVNSSTTIAPTFEYVIEDDSWTTFTPSDDTAGLQNSGTMRFDSDNLTSWAMKTVNEVTGGAVAGSTDYYWIKITRTRNNVATPPTESTIKVTTTGTFHTWDKEGRLGIKTFNQAAEPTTTDLPADLFCFWTDTDDSKLYICYNHGGTIKTTEMT